MEIERQRLSILQKTFKFLEKIESKLPYNLAYECSRIKEAMTCVGASPNYINIPGDPDAHKTTLERRNREPLTIIKKLSPFYTAKCKGSNEKETISRKKNSPEFDNISRTLTPTNLQSQSQSTSTKFKKSISPFSSHPYSNGFHEKSEARDHSKTSGHTDYPLRRSQSPLPPTPITPNDHFISATSICRSPLSQTPTRAFKESPPIPKNDELVGDDVMFMLGVSPVTPKCHTQCSRVAHSYLNVVETKTKPVEYQNMVQVKANTPKKREMIHN